MNIINKILNEIPDNLTDIEKARYMYIALGKYFSYDEQFVISNSDKEKKQIFDRNVEELVGDKAVCTSISRVYEKILNEIGINATTIIRDGLNIGHAYTEVEINNETYKTDLIHDLMNIKTGFKTHSFMGRAEDKYSYLEEDDLKKIDDKIGYTYKRNVYGRI